MNLTKNKSILPTLSSLPTTYTDLCAMHMPRTIHDAIEFQNITEIIDLMAGQNLNKDQEDYLATLAELSAAYEDAHVEDFPKMSPQEFLSAHLQNIGMSAATWGKLIGIDRSTASRLLRGERKLNTDHIRKTARALHIAPGLLI